MLRIYFVENKRETAHTTGFSLPEGGGRNTKFVTAPVHAGNSTSAPPAAPGNALGKNFCRRKRNS